MSDSNLKGRIRSNRKSPISSCANPNIQKTIADNGEKDKITDSLLSSSLYSKEKSTTK
jgi:hypothetical protein